MFCFFLFKNEDFMNFWLKLNNFAVVYEGFRMILWSHKMSAYWLTFQLYISFKKAEYIIFFCNT